MTRSGWGDWVTVTVASAPKDKGGPPSMDNCRGTARLRTWRLMVMSAVGGKSAGRKESDRGQMGVSKIPSTPGCTIGPPAERE